MKDSIRNNPRTPCLTSMDLAAQTTEGKPVTSAQESLQQTWAWFLPATDPDPGL